MIKLGYEIGTGAQVVIPLRHLAVTGQTQESGKTTTLEALITRSGLRAVAFVTKRGEKSFRVMSPIPIYFREPEITAETPMWEWVGAILSVAMQGETKPIGKEEQAAIIQASDSVLRIDRKVTKSTGNERLRVVPTGQKVESFEDVHRNIGLMIEAGAAGGFKRACICLDAYFKKVLPQIRRLKGGRDLALRPGVNVMDLEGLTDEMQSLVIRSVIEIVYRKMRGVAVIVPEAAKFIPNRRQSPVRFAAEMFIRQGLGIGNLLWIDSQDLANVATEVLKSVGVWILGKQTEVNEVRRVVNYIPAAPRIPEREIQQLGRGEFYVVYSDQVRKVYVQPAGMEDVHARAIATGDESADSWKAIVRTLPKSDPESTPNDNEKERSTTTAVTFQGSPAGFAVPAVHETATDDEQAAVHHAHGAAVPRNPADAGKAGAIADGAGAADHRHADVLAARIEALEKENQRIRAEIDFFRSQRVSQSPVSPEQISAKPLPPAVHITDFHNGAYDLLKRRILADEQVLAKISVLAPEIEVRTLRHKIEMSGDTLQGRVARMIAANWFAEPRSGPQVQKELARYGCSQPTTNVYRALDKLAELGFLTKEDSGYLVVLGMKVHLVEP